MENASKALIIAGAILISIILISIGVMVVNSGTQLTDEAARQMSEQELQAYNRKYTQYIGNQRGSSIRSIIQDVMANNSTSPEMPIKVTITATGMSSGTFEGNAISPLIGQVKSSSSYDMQVEYSDAGRVCEIKIGNPTTNGGTTDV